MFFRLDMGGWVAQVLLFGPGGVDDSVSVRHSRAGGNLAAVYGPQESGFPSARERRGYGAYCSCFFSLAFSSTILALRCSISSLARLIAEPRRCFR